MEKRSFIVAMETPPQTPSIRVMICISFMSDRAVGAAERASEREQCVLQQFPELTRFPAKKHLFTFTLNTI